MHSVLSMRARFRRTKLSICAGVSSPRARWRNLATAYAAREKLAQLGEPKHVSELHDRKGSDRLVLDPRRRSSLAVGQLSVRGSRPVGERDGMRAHGRERTPAVSLEGITRQYPTHGGPTHVRSCRQCQLPLRSANFTSSFFIHSLSETPKKKNTSTRHSASCNVSWPTRSRQRGTLVRVSETCERDIVALIFHLALYRRYMTDGPETRYHTYEMRERRLFAGD